MSDLTRYRIEKFGGNTTLNYRLDAGALVATNKLGGKMGVLVPDDTLQQIADAWREYKTRASIGGEWTELAALLDSLGVEPSANADTYQRQLADEKRNEDECGCTTGSNHAEFNKALAAGYDPMPGEYLAHLTVEENEHE